MKRFIWLAMVVIAVFSACQFEEPHTDKTAGGDELFFAAIQNEGSYKTALDDNSIRWCANDQIVIFNKSTLGAKYQIQDSYIGETSGYFSKVTSGLSSDDSESGMSVEHNIAYYPYSGDVMLAKSAIGYTLDIALPSEQIYAPESFGNGTFPMAAVSKDNDLTFKNVCGGIKLHFKGKCKIASIKIEGKNNEKLSGGAVVTVYSDNSAPAIAMANDAMTSVTLNCGDGVQLSEETATEFIISLPPIKFTEGFAITVTDTDGGTQIIETSKENEVKRSSLLNMPEVDVQTIKFPVTLNEGENGELGVLLYNYICKNYDPNIGISPNEEIFIFINESTGAWGNGRKAKVTLIMTTENYNHTYGKGPVASGIGFEVDEWSGYNGFALSPTGFCKYWSKEK